MSLPMNSLYSLTWGDYGTSLVSAVQLLRCHGDLVDCTLAAGGRSFPAHKIVLCAASPFLLDLLKNTPCTSHPIVMLAGVNATDLEALLEFVYRGEVSVDHSQLPSLLQAAHCLNIQGLAPQTVTKDDYNTTSIQLHPSLLAQHHVKAVIDVGNGNMNEELMTTIHESSPQHQTIQAHVVEEIMPEQLTEVTDVKEVINQLLPTRKRKPRVKRPSAPKTEGSNTTHEIENSPPKPKKPKTPRDPNKIKSRSQSEQPASCPICGAVIKQSRNLRRHLELRHFSKPGIKKERKSSTNTNIPNMQTVTVKKEPEEISTSQQEQTQQIHIQQPQTQTIAVSVAPNPSTTHTIETSNTSASQSQHIVTHHDNSDGSTSLQIAQVQNLTPATHQLTLSNLGQQSKNHIVLKKVIFVKGNSANT